MTGACRVESHGKSCLADPRADSESGLAFACLSLRTRATTAILALSITDPHDQPSSLLAPSEITRHALSHGNAPVVHDPYAAPYGPPVISLTKSPHVLSKTPR